TVGDLSVHTETHPTDTVPGLDRGQLLRRHDGRVENVDRIVCAVCQPKFSFIWGKGNSVTGTAMAFYRTFFVALNFYVVELFPCLKISNFEAQQAIHVYENQTATPVHGKRTDYVLEWPYGFNDSIGVRIGYRKKRRFQAGQIDIVAINRPDRIVGTGVRLDRGNHIARGCIHYVPRRPL